MRQLNYIKTRTLEWHDVPEPGLPSDKGAVFYFLAQIAGGKTISSPMEKSFRSCSLMSDPLIPMGSRFFA